jgi:hypothetical protein
LCRGLRDDHLFKKHEDKVPDKLKDAINLVMKHSKISRWANVETPESLLIKRFNAKHDPSTTLTVNIPCLSAG